MGNVRATVVDAVTEVCGLEPERLTDDAALTTLGIDSMDILEVGAVVEERLNVQIDFDSVSDVETFGEAVELFARLLAA